MSRQCRGYANSLPIIAPIITGLSTTSSILGTTTVVTIFGENFRNYSTVYFGTTLINNVTYFSSGQLSFYVPAVSSVGAYPIQVFNDTLASNIVFFTVDNSVGFWNQDPSTGAITNNNSSGGVNINGQLTVNAPIKLNYSPSAITSDNIGYQFSLSFLSYSNTSENYSNMLNLTTIPTGVWLVTGTTGSNTIGITPSSTISEIQLLCYKNGTVIGNQFYQITFTNCGSSCSIPFSFPFISNGTDQIYIQLYTSTNPFGKFNTYVPGINSQITFLRIA
jgi:hypothetical protein